MTSRFVSGGYRLTKEGKIEKVHKLSASKKIGQKAKAERQAKAWTAKSKKSERRAKS